MIWRVSSKSIGCVRSVSSVLVLIWSVNWYHRQYFQRLSLTVPYLPGYHFNQRLDEGAQIRRQRDKRRHTDNQISHHLVEVHGRMRVRGASSRDTKGKSTSRRTYMYKRGVIW